MESLSYSEQHYLSRHLTSLCSADLMHSRTGFPGTVLPRYGPGDVLVFSRVLVFILERGSNDVVQLRL